MHISWKKNKILTNTYVIGISAALVLNFLIEVFSRHSIIAAFNYLEQSPLIFLYNTGLILFTFLPILLIRRRIALFALLSAIWLSGGITNGIILNNRVTPFTANELKLISSTFDIMQKYFNVFQIALLVSAIVLSIVGIVVVVIKAPKTKTKVNYRKNGSVVAIGVLSFFLVTKGALGSGLVDTTFGNIAFAYLDYGFPYCFANSLVNVGISRPATYSEESIHALRQQLKDSKETVKIDETSSVASTENTQPTLKEAPNIIMIQLESFFDPTKLTDLTFSQDPIPNFRELQENYSSGFVAVPSIGAGTANTEFEVITGMSLQFFGPGEYPYKTVLRDTTAESISFNLNDLGYTTHAIHNNRGTFYTRQRVFKSLGFNTFTPIEYMNNIEETTPTGWAKDKYLIDPIFDALNATESSDFIYTISVQGHGDYPTTLIEGHSEITVTGWDDISRLNAMEYYTNEIHQMDHFIGELVQNLSLYSEDVVLVLFGDHLPTMDIKDEELDNGNIFQTPYVIWSNFDLSKEDVDLTAYQLSAHVLNKLGISEGTLTSFHQNFKDEANYLENLKLLQYDILYGERYIYNGESPYDFTDLKLGVKPIIISDAYTTEDGNLMIEGENFTPYSRVKINSSTHETIYIDAQTLLIEDYELQASDKISIQQVTSTNHVLGTSTPYQIEQSEEEKTKFDQAYQEGYEAGYQEALKALKEENDEELEE